MSGPLPPSKFGAGTTYGEHGQAYGLPQSRPPASPAPSPSPQNQPVVDPYSATPHQASHAADPHAQTYYAPHTPDSYAASHAASYPAQPVQGPAGRPGGGTAIAAAILCLVGALWYGVDTIRNWAKFEMVFQMLDASSAYGVGDGWAYGFIAAAIAQLVFVVLLLVGGVLLLARSSAGRGLAVAGSALVLAANGYLALAGLQAVSDMNAFFDSAGMSPPARNDLIADILLNTGVPALIAVFALVMLTTSTTKRWCRPAAQTY